MNTQDPVFILTQNIAALIAGRAVDVDEIQRDARKLNSFVHERLAELSRLPGWNTDNALNDFVDLLGREMYLMLLQVLTRATFDARMAELRANK